MSAKCSFGRVSVNGVWESEYSFGTDLDARFLYIRDGGRQWLLAVFDFCYLFRRTCLQWRSAVSQALGIPAENIWIHTLQNHSAPCAPDLDGPAADRLADRCIPVISEMTRRAEEANLAYVVIDTAGKFNMNREQYVPGLGNVTVWGGFEFDETGRPYTQDAALMMLAGWQPELPAFKSPIYFDRPADPHAALLVFQGRRGNMLGSIARFTAHPDVVGSCWDKGGAKPEEYRYHFDWPGFLRQRVEERLGSVCVAVCGPCGNVAPKKTIKPGYEWGVCEAQRIGNGIADLLLEQWQAAAPPPTPLELGRCAVNAVELPLRPGFPRSREKALAEAAQRAAQLRREFESGIRTGAPAYQIKHLIDEYWHWTWMPKLLDRWVGLSAAELAGGFLRVETNAVRLNELALAGLPGESMCETSQWLRANSLGRRLLTLDQINGYCAYQTTQDQYDMGGYAYACSVLARESESLTRKTALSTIYEAMEMR